MSNLHIGVGVTVDYHGSLTGYHGHRMTITRRYITSAARMRYDLADHTGRTVLINVAPGSVTPIRTAPTNMWTDRATAIRNAADRNDHPAATIATHLHQLAKLVGEHRYHEAKRALLDLETLTGLADPADFTTACGELDAFYLARQHGVPIPVNA